MSTYYTSDEQAANRAKLVAALRSGEYVQGRCRLRRSNGARHRPLYCCLGVACQISGLGSFDDDNDMFITAEEGAPEGVVLPRAVRQWFGFDTAAGDFKAGAGIDCPRNNRASSLTEANDGGLPFTKIADIIEEGRIKITPTRKAPQNG